MPIIPHEIRIKLPYLSIYHHVSYQIIVVSCVFHHEITTGFFHHRPNNTAKAHRQQSNLTEIHGRALVEGWIPTRLTSVDVKRSFFRGFSASRYIKYGYNIYIYIYQIIIDANVVDLWIFCQLEPLLLETRHGVFLTSDKLIISGWRLTYPSEKYGSQLGIWNSQLNGKS